MDEIDKRTKNLKAILEQMRNSAGETDPAGIESLELIRAFFMIKDIESRRKVIDLAKSLSKS